MGGGTLLTSILVISVLGVLLFLILNRNQKLKYLKKMTSVALILTMLLLPFSNLLNVKAEGTTINVDSNNKVLNIANINGYVTTGVTDSFRAYKVLDAYYNEKTNEMSYKFTTAFQEFLASSTDDDLKNLTIDKYISYGYDSSDSTLTSAERDEKNKAIRKLADSFARYIRSNDKTFQTYDLTNTDSKISGQVEVGSYLVLPISINKYGSEQHYAFRYYHATIVNAVFRVENNDWYLNDISLDIKSNDRDATFILTDDNPENSLKALMMEEGKVNFGVDMLFRANKTYTYVFMGRISETNDDTITITLPDGLKFVQGEIKYLSNGEEDNFKLSEINDKLTDDYSGAEFATAVVGEKQVVITVTPRDGDAADIEYIYLFIGVELDNNSENIVLGESGNIIKTDYEMVVDPYTPTPTKKTLSLENKVTTYGLQITNTEVNNSSTLLSNAVFGIYTDEECSDANLVGTLTTDSNGIAKFNGIIDEVYYIKQIKAATGYKLNTNPAKITVDTASLNSDNYFPLDISSAKTGLLPSTGGLGTIFYTLVGLLVIGIGSYAVIKYSKKQINS